MSNIQRRLLVSPQVTLAPEIVQRLSAQVERAQLNASTAILQDGLRTLVVATPEESVV